MTRGKSRLGLGVICALAAILVAVPAPASAASGVDEYTLGLDLGGNDSSDGSEETTAPVPATPYYQTTAPTYETTTIAPKKRKRPKEELAPALAASSANASLGPNEVPPLKVADDESGLPLGLILIAALAAACCVLAVWRLRFLRELPVSRKRRVPRTASVPTREMPVAAPARAPRSAT